MTTTHRTPPTLTWPFPLPRTHAGILLGNGLQGLMVWGDAVLSVTVARSGFWDHRGGRTFSVRSTFGAVRQALEARDEPTVKRIICGDDANAPVERHRPHQVGGGRIELRFPDGLVPVTGRLDTARAILSIELANTAGRREMVAIHQAMDALPDGELAWLAADAELLRQTDVRLIAAWDVCAPPLADMGIAPPSRWQEGRSGGFVQTLPDDAPLAIAWAVNPTDGILSIATALGDATGDRARATAGEAIDPQRRAAHRERADRWWSDYWSDVPAVEVPDASLQHSWDYGLYKQAGLTTPCDVAATLQGPWMEEYQLPPWSNDYHFNINVQLVYGPCLPTNRAGHLQPLWTMVKGWFPQMKTNGEGFFGAKGAMMLPHAVDDRCRAIGTFWAGTIDHACTAWVALMAWQHYRYTLDEQVLREVAWPLLVGAFEGFYAMAEEVPDGRGGTRLSLPVSVSPEYNGSSMDAWGRDASFQLAAFRRVAEVLSDAATMLGHPIDARWDRALAKVPPYTLFNPGDERPRMALWHGQDLAVSHRHHSHMASIYPFCSIDPYAPQHQRVVAGSIAHWNHLGPGNWTGWCVPWAAILCARLGLATAAVTWLAFWKQTFTNVGHGTLHNADFSGVTAWADNALNHPDLRVPPDAPNRELMQMDAGMGAVTAIAELLVQCRRDAVHVLPAIPKGWRDARFTNVRAEGAIGISATLRDGVVTEIRIRSDRGGPVRIAHHLGDQWTVGEVAQTGPMYEAKLKAGEEVVLRPAMALRAS